MRSKMIRSAALGTLVVFLVTFSSDLTCAAFAAPKRQLQRELNRLLESQAMKCDESKFRRINALGKRADGEFGEYYGERLFDFLLKDTAKACFLRYLISSKEDDRKFILKALRYEAQIRDSKNPCMQIELLLKLYRGKISANQYGLIARRLCLQVSG